MNKVILGIASVLSVCVLALFVQQEHNTQRQQQVQKMTQEVKHSLTLIERQFLQQEDYVNLSIISNQ